MKAGTGIFVATESPRNPPAKAVPIKDRSML